MPSWWHAVRFGYVLFCCAMWHARGACHLAVPGIACGICTDLLAWGTCLQMMLWHKSVGMQNMLADDAAHARHAMMIPASMVIINNAGFQSG